MARPTRFLRAVAAAVALTTLAPAGAGAAGPGCDHYDLEVVCRSEPLRVRVGEEFAATATARNSGSVVLKDVLVQIRADMGVPCAASPGAVARALLPELAPGESTDVTARFLPETAGFVRLLGSARDGGGFAAANCACDVEAFPVEGLGLALTDRPGGAEKPRPKTGDAIRYSVSVDRDPSFTDTPPLRLDVALSKGLEFVSGASDSSIAVTGSDRSAASAPFRFGKEATRVRFEIVVRALEYAEGKDARVRVTLLTSTGAVVATAMETTPVSADPLLPKSKLPSDR